MQVKEFVHLVLLDINVRMELKVNVKLDIMQLKEMKFVYSVPKDINVVHQELYIQQDVQLENIKINKVNQVV